MREYNPIFVEVESLKEARKEIEKIGSDSKSINIMAPKAVSKVIKLKNVILQDAIIMKQDLLSIGGEVAIPKDAYKLVDKKADILIMGTIKQLNDLVKKLNRHYPRLKRISIELQALLETII
jgi:dihydropteroate synthase